MPSIPYSRLLDAVQDAVVSSGHSSSLISQPNDVPARYLLSGPSLGSLPLWVYIKNLTPADRSDDDEYRIQLRGSIVPLALNPHGPTLLLGYHASSGLFVGFDAHAVSSGAATQLSGGYVSLRVVKRAKRKGMSFDRDRRNRIAVGLRPDLLVPYALNAIPIHAASDEERIIELLSTAATAFAMQDGSLIELPDQGIAPERQRLLRTVRTLARDAGFRSRVLAAYGCRCAISGIQLGLVEAAHILPVSVQGSDDRVQNGLSLLPHFHRAFDSGLIYLDRDYVMRVNAAQARQLIERDLGQGLDEIRQALGRIRLPRSRQKWPDTNLIAQANAARGVRTR